MKKEDWEKYDALYKKYEDARAEYEAAQMKLRGAFSEMARHFDEGTLDHNRLYEEAKAHERFLKARDKLHKFLDKKLNKNAGKS